MSSLARWVSSAVIACFVVGITASVGYYWSDVTQRLERAGLEGWGLGLVRLLLVPGLGVLGALLIRWLWRAPTRGARS